MTRFSFATVLAAPSVGDVVAAYFDPEHLAAQDKVAELCERTVIEDSDGEVTRRTTWRVRAVRLLPVFARSFVEGGRIVYLETLVWRKRDEEIDVTIVPQILGGRISVRATESLTQVGQDQVRCHYWGTIDVDLRLISGFVERRILAEIEEGMPAMRDCTQAWLHRRYS